jgi:hypothetical protein
MTSIKDTSMRQATQLDKKILTNTSIFERNNGTYVADNFTGMYGGALHQRIPCMCTVCTPEHTMCTLCTLPKGLPVTPLSRCHSRNAFSFFRMHSVELLAYS